MIEVIHPGLYSSIQDSGRFGQQFLGVPISGAMDQIAMHWANSLLNNPKDSAVLEMCFRGPKLLFHQSTAIALAGAHMNATLNGVKVQNLNAIEIKENDILEFGNASKGTRTYMAVAGGIQSPEILGSRSQFKGITTDSRLNKYKLIPFAKVSFVPKKGARLSIPKLDLKKLKITVYKGPDYDLLPFEAQNQLTKSVFTISPKNSRMAYFLEQKLIHEIPSLWTTPVLPGTVQCTPDGTLMILMRDAQTTGGYPRVLQVSDEGLNLLAQKSTRDSFQFHLRAV
jgi:biotin-dependent carboxylase-like uncharacterized protein